MSMRRDLTTGLLIGVPFGLAATVLLFFLWNPFYYKNLAVSFRDEMRSKADIAAIRKWFLEMSVEERQNIDSIPFKKLPPCLVGLGARATLLTDPNGNQELLMLYRGSGFGHWGIIVGPSDMNVPMTTDRWYYIPFRDGEKGVWVFADAK